MRAGEESEPPGGGEARSDRDPPKGSSDAIDQARLWLAHHGLDQDAVEAVTDARAAAARTGDTPAAWPALPDGDPDSPDADPESVARTIVLRKLAAQARTRQELNKALQAKHVRGEVADIVLDRMESAGLVNDAALARDWVESRQQRRHLSRQGLRRELATKGVESAEIESALSGVDDDDELHAARSLAEKKLRSMRELQPEVRYRRLAGVLARRGFGPGVINRVLSEAL
ncbi:MAG: regulatory protein RecX [Propionibacteriaceae bacterium]|nr:regulatory protein RecX [Propionibacteriaceae bacterium]